MNETDQLIAKQIKKLPRGVGEAISKVDWKGNVKGIADKCNLTADQARSLETEVLLLIYSFESSDDFEDNLIKNVSVDEETADKIADLVEDEILGSIEKKLDELEPHMNLSPRINLGAQLEIEPPEAELLLQQENTEIDEPVAVPIATPVPEPRFQEVKVEQTHKIINILDTPAYADPKPVAKEELVPMTTTERIGDSLSPGLGFIPPQIHKETPPLNQPAVNTPIKTDTPVVNTPGTKGYTGGIDPYREQI